MTKTAKEIIQQNCSGRLSTLASSYSGRGNNAGDLDTRMLMDIHGGLTRDIGENAAAGFVEMVKDLTDAGDISAMTFLVSFYRFESAGWQWQGTAPTRAEAMAELATNALRDDDKGSMSGLMDGLSHIINGIGGRGSSAGEVSGAFLVAMGVAGASAGHRHYRP